METLAQPLNREAGDGIARLDGRQGARGFFGLTGRRAESVALGCRHRGKCAHARGARFMDRELRDAGQRRSASKRRMPRVEPVVHGRGPRGRWALLGRQASVPGVIHRGWRGVALPPFDPPGNRAPEEVADEGAAPFPPCRCGVMPERRTARRHRPHIGGRVRHRVVAEAKAYPDGVSTSNVLPAVAFGPPVGGPVLSAGRPYRCRSTSVHGASGVAGHEIASAMDTPPVPYVAGALAIVPRPPERRCRSGHRGRGWERPPISACLDRHRAGWRCTSPSAPPLRVAPSQQSFQEGCRAPLRGGGGRVGRPAGRRAVRHRRPRPGRGRPGCAMGLPAKDRWPVATSCGGWHGRVHAEPPPWHARRHRRGVATVTPASFRAPRPRLRPCRNRKAGRDMRNHGRVR